MPGPGPLGSPPSCDTHVTVPSIYVPVLPRLPGFVLQANLYEVLWISVHESAEKKGGILAWR